MSVCENEITSQTVLWTVVLSFPNQTLKLPDSVLHWAMDGFSQLDCNLHLHILEVYDTLQQEGQMSMLECNCLCNLKNYLQNCL